jgi:hypothetical protein
MRPRCRETPDSRAANAGRAEEWSRAALVPWSLNTWYHVAATRDPTGNFRLFVNGNQAGTTVAKSTSTDCTTQPLTIGASTNNFTRFNGAIDDVRLYNRALSPAEIQTLYTSAR